MPTAWYFQRTGSCRVCTRALRQWRSRPCSARVAWLPASSNKVLPAAREISVLKAENAKLYDDLLFAQRIIGQISHEGFELIDENEKLRDDLETQREVATDNTRRNMREYKRVRDENDKLRELVKLMHMTIKDLQEAFDASVVVGGVELSAEYFEAEYMRELGIEADG